MMRKMNNQVMMVVLIDNLLMVQEGEEVVDVFVLLNLLVLSNK
jgi:hypothetical protein